MRIADAESVQNEIIKSWDLLSRHSDMLAGSMAESYLDANKTTLENGIVITLRCGREIYATIMEGVWDLWDH